MLDWLAARVGDLGPICDLGCGPGQVGAYLHDRGAMACGIDLSAAMVGEARTRNPGVGFEQGDMLDLADVADASFGGIAAFYAIVNVARTMLGTAFGEMARVLRPGGIALLSFHIGNEMRHLDELLGVAVALDLSFIETAEVTTRLREADLEVTEAIEREPYPSTTSTRADGPTSSPASRTRPTGQTGGTRLHRRAGRGAGPVEAQDLVHRIVDRVVRFERAPGDQAEPARAQRPPRRDVRAVDRHDDAGDIRVAPPE